MKQLLQYLSDFKNNKGFSILSSSIVQKIAMFAVSLLAIDWLPKEAYGQVSYVMSIIGVLLLVSALGMNYSFLYFGSVATTRKIKNEIFRFCLNRGLFFSLLFAILVLAVSPFLDKGESNITLYFAILVWRMPSFFLQSIRLAKFRIYKENTAQAKFEIIGSVLHVIIGIAALYLFGAIGFLATLVLVPIFNVLAFRPRGLILDLFKPPRGLVNRISSKKAFNYYAFSSVAAALVSQALIAVDIIFISHMLGDESAAEYKVATLIPLNLIIIPMVFMKTDLTRLIENRGNYTFLKNYAFNYLGIITVLAGVIYVGGIILGPYFFQLFGGKYNPVDVFHILLVGMLVSIAIKIPIGNFVAGIGRSNVNFIFSIVTLVIVVVLNFILIPKMGFIGAAWSTFIGLLFSALCYLIYFYMYMNRLRNAAN